MPHSKRRLIFSGSKQVSFNCCNCGKKFPSKKFLDKHILVSHKSSVGKLEVFIICDICEKSFLSKFNLNKHKRLVHKNI